MRQKPRAKLRLHVYKQAKLMHLILYTARHNIFILAHEKNYFEETKIQVKVKIVTIQHPEFNAKHVNL
jgi:hypothetical protein